MDHRQTRALLDAPSAAVLAVYRADETVLISPVWFRTVDDWVEVVIAEGDAKLERLRVDPRCVFLAFETVVPFRGLRIQADARLVSEGVREARLAIASRYLGTEDGQRWVDQRTKPGTIVWLPLSAARSWYLGPILPT